MGKNGVFEMVEHGVFGIVRNNWMGEHGVPVIHEHGVYT